MATYPSPILQDVTVEGAFTPSSVAATGTVTGSNLSGTNTGDQTNITGTSANVTGIVAVANGGTGAATLTGLVKGTGTTAMVAATAGTDYVIPSGSITGNAGTATKLQTARTLNGVSFDGSANVVTALTLPVNAQTGTAYTLALTDAPANNGYEGVVTMNNAAANVLTVPPNSSVAFPVGTQIQVVQLGAGQTSIAAGSGATVSNPSSLTARAQYSSLVLTQVAANIWVLGGDMT